MTEAERKELAERLAEQDFFEKVDRGVREGVAAAIRKHAEAREWIAFEEDGKIVTMPAREALERERKKEEVARQASLS